jgi:alpha-tubulin suppressor-like RCC1 family protein
VKAKGNLVQILLLGVVLLQAVVSGAQPVTKIAGAYEHSLFLKSDGSLWAVGYNQYGQLGDGTYATGYPYSTNRPEQIVASNVTVIAAGYYNSLFLKGDGSLWAMGYNHYGELGDGTTSNTNRPEMIVASNVVAIAAGDEYSLFIKSDGSLWGMGRNDGGQLGDGTTSNTNRPEQIVPSNVTAISAGGHSLFIKSDGSLWAMGDNPYGELGDGTTSNTNRPEMIVASGVTAISAGGEHSLFIKSDGSLWAMGDNFYGELGDGTYDGGLGYTNRPEQIVPSNVTAIAAGASHSLFLKSDGSLWTMGFNQDGQLGNAANNNINRPGQIVTSNVTTIAAGWFHSLFLKSDGSLWAMGDNFYGQLGDGDGNYNNTNRPEQTLAAYNQITGQVLSGGNMQLSFVGIAIANYALDRSSSLSPPNWMPQVTNAATSWGALVFTNTPDPTTNNFWRIRSVP